MTELVLQILLTGHFPPNIYHTFIALIPKKNPTISISNFHPISLCNIMYKLISKVIENRLKLILPLIISETQSVFVLG